MGARMRALDWTKTPLGDPESWPQSLKTIVRVMLDSRYAMWMLWGPEYTFFCNDAYLPTVGLKRDWVLGARSDKVWAEIWPDVESRITQVLEQGAATWDEALLLFLERSGFREETYHTFSYSPVYDDDGRIAGMLCVVTEVTEHVLDERGLRVLRDLAARVAGAQTVTEVCSRLMAVLRDDPADIPFALLYVLEPESAQARLVADCGAVPDRFKPGSISLHDDHAAWPLLRAAEHGEALSVELPSGATGIPSSIWPDHVTRALVIPIKNPLAQGTGAVLITGVSPRRALNERYRRFFDLLGAQFAAALNDAQSFEAERRRAEALAALDRAKTRFFSNVSHEFRTPLTLLLGPIEEMLADPSVPAQQLERLGLAHRNSLRLLKLVNSLLEVSRLEAGRVTASYEPTDIALVTRDISSTFRSAIERVGLTFEVDCAPLGQSAYIDCEMWEKIVLNLLSNAFKFTLEGTIGVRLRQDASDAVLEVTDTGAGVPEAEIPRLFERFHRVEGTRGRTHEGSGIGLALVHELVKLHGGSIEVQSQLGHGTTFRIRIPLGSAHLPAARVKAERTVTTSPASATAFVQEALRWASPTDKKTRPALALPTSPAPSDERFASTFGSRILLADDNADMREYVRELLSPHYIVETAVDGQDALAKATQRAPELILSDVMMPRLDGFGLLTALRANDSLSRVPVILLSARAGEESRIEGLDAGADDYLVKPFSARELLARVGAMLERERFHAQARQQFETAARQKDEFLAMLAHELRNPLAPIRNAGELLSRSLPSDARAQAAAGIVRRQVSHLTRLVDDLLDVSRITQGRIDLRREPVPLTEVIAHALETVEPLLREKRHKVSVTQSFETLRVNGDPARLVQCVANVLTNAAKYTDPNGDVRIETRREASVAVITIIDNGPGIAPDLLPRVFELFVQGTRTLDRSQGGLGIGLSVVRRLVEMHGGEVHVTSNVDQGTAFEFRLPLIESPVTAEIAPSPSAVVHRRILVVDDNEDAAESLAMLLSMDGHDVRTVNSAQAALDAIRHSAPDVMLLDIGLPDIDGYEVARRVRAMPDVAQVRIVALTGYGQSEDRRRTESIGFHGHLVKPVDLALLQRTLDRLD
jgi:signal transduction histidine kinase